jgi:hypothetical protein
MIRIGHSINLAFPPRKDQLRLCQLLALRGFDKDPPIAEVLKLVGTQIKLFGERFQEAYESFRSAYTSGRTELDRLPFWAAVRAAVASEWDDLEAAEEKLELKLVMEVNENGEAEIVLVSTRRAPSTDGRLCFLETEAPYGPFKYVLSGSDEFGERFSQAARLILKGRLFKDFGLGKARCIDVIAQQGVLLFRLQEDGAKELVLTRCDHGRYWALVRSDLSAAFAEAFPHEYRPKTYPSQYVGWIEVSEFNGELFACLSYPEQSPLCKVRCLQETVTARQMRLIGGCPVDGGFLGLPGCLPHVHAPGATLVYACPIGDSTEPGHPRKLRMNLNEALGSIREFHFDPSICEPLTGRHMITAQDGDRVISQRTVTFRADLAWNDYTQPMDPSAWLVEFGGPEVLRFDFLDRESVKEQMPTATKAKRSLPSIRWDQLPELPARDGKDWLSRGSEESGLEITLEAKYFVEMCGGLATRRKGIPEPEFLDRLSNCLGIKEYGLLWDVARAWVEAGYFDRLHFQRWRNTIYFARAPRLVIYEREGRVHGTLMGLATEVMRTRVKTLAEKVGAESKQRRSLSEWVPSPLSWSAKTIEAFQIITSEAGLLPPQELKPLRSAIWPLERISVKETDTPINYEQSGVWDWFEGNFSRFRKLDCSGVEVRWLRRPDRPDCFEIFVDGVSYWWSRSRNWALLIAHVLRKKPFFAIAGQTSLIRVTKGQVYLPISVGRSLAVTADSLSGPYSTARGERHYLYVFLNQRERNQFMNVLQGGPCTNAQKLARDIRWVLKLLENKAMTASGRLVPLPRELRNELRGLRGIGGVEELSGLMVPPPFIWHVRKILNRNREEGRR